MSESFTDGLIGHGGYPQSFHRAFYAGFLHYPALDQFSFLTGITTVDDQFGRVVQLLNDGKLLLDAFVFDEFYAEAWGNHRECRQAPVLPVGEVIIRLFQLTKMAEGPCHLVVVAFHVTIAGLVGSKNPGYVFRNTGFLCYANYHVFL